MKVYEHLNGYKAEQYHIFDSHQEGMDKRGVKHLDQDYITYSYNIHKNNKPKPGDMFMYRRPGKSSKTRKFHIYGGGIIDEIKQIDKEGTVIATIKHPFKLETPLSQGDEQLENFNWESKNKKEGSWMSFWNQYGMNVISENDFFNLIGDLECSFPGNRNYTNASTIEANEENVVLNDEAAVDNTSEEIFDPSDFDITLDNEGERMPVFDNKKKHKTKGVHVNYEKQQKNKSTIGKAGELLVMDLLLEQYKDTDYTVEHSSVIKGDGLGYDILVTAPDLSEILIEVKTTKTSYVDGFYITPTELNAARKCESPNVNRIYKIYRLYNFDPKSKAANLKIYDGVFSDENFRFAPVGWKVYER